MVSYFTRAGIPASRLLENTDLTWDLLQEGNHWISYRDLVFVMKNCQENLPGTTLYDWETAGMP